MSWSQEELEKLYQDMMQLSSTDEEFRKKLLADPNGTLAELGGKPLPEGYKVNIIENDPGYTATCVLPDMLSEELTAEELDQLEVDGGWSFFLIGLLLPACGVAVGGDVGIRIPSFCGVHAGGELGTTQIIPKIAACGVDATGCFMDFGGSKKKTQKK
jgi:hypothetical protein